MGRPRRESQWEGSRIPESVMMGCEPPFDQFHTVSKNVSMGVVTVLVLGVAVLSCVANENG